MKYPNFPFRTGIFMSLTLLTLVAVFSACKKEAVDTIDCSGITPTYTSSVKSILDASCAKSGCHDAATAESGVNLSTYASAKSISQEDRFLGTIQHKSGYPAMPENEPKLSNDKIEQLTCWVQNGSPQ